MGYSLFTEVNGLFPLKVKGKVAQSCDPIVILCDPIPVHGILQARTLEWVAFPFSRGSSQPRNQTGVSCIAGGFFTNRTIKEAHYVKSNQ